MPRYRYLIEDEWEVVSNRTDQGRGDLVFTDGDRAFATIEVKWIDLPDSNRNSSTVQVSRRKKRRKVEEQAAKYATLYAKKRNLCLEAVEAFIFTNDCDRPCPITVYY